MNRLLLITPFFLTVIYCAGQAPVDSMPVAQPKVQDTASVVVPSSKVENMPVVVPDQVPPQQSQPNDNVIKPPTSGKRRTKKN